jgi:dipeptidyl aminopeptidase/acylaminoacyl peptidase
MTDAAAFELSAAAVAHCRTLGEPRWSPGGARLGWLEVAGGRVDLVVVPADGSAPPLQVTAAVPVTKLGSYGGGGWCWAPAGDQAGEHDGGQAVEQVVYAGVDGRLLVIAPAGGPVRTLADEGTAAAPACAAGRVAFVRETDETCRIAVVPLDGGAAPAELSDADYAWDPAWSPDGEWLVWHEWDLPAMPWDASRIVVARADGRDRRIVTGAAGSPGAHAVAQPRFSPDGAHLAWVSDANGWMQVWVATFDREHGDLRDERPLLDEAHEHAEPSWGPGQRSYAWSPDGAEIVLNRNEDGFGRLVIVDLASGRPRERSKGWHHGVEWGAPGIVCVRSGGRTAPQVTVLDPAVDLACDLTRGGSAGRRALARGAPGELDALDLPEPDLVTWAGPDGATVHGILWRPLPVLPVAAADGRPAGTPPPLLVDVHGGPTGQAVVGWSPRVRWFLSRGWAVLAPNPRGSTGYGREYLRALDEGWGDVDVADTVTGIRTLAARGAVDGERVAVMGGSAGGFTALLVGAATPPVVQAVVSLYGVTDLVDLAATTHRFESRYLDTLVGPLPACADRYRDRSPVTRAHEIGVPVLVLQGDQDKVVPPAQAELLVDALRAAGTEVEHHVYAGEGHGWSRPDTVIDALERTEAFLTRWVLR